MHRYCLSNRDHPAFLADLWHCNRWRLACENKQVQIGDAVLLPIGIEFQRVSALCDAAKRNRFAPGEIVPVSLVNGIEFGPWRQLVVNRDKNRGAWQAVFRITQS